MIHWIGFFFRACYFLRNCNIIALLDVLNDDDVCTYVPVLNSQIRSDVDPYLRGVPPTKAMSCYDSRQRYSSYTVVHTKMKDAVTHSSYWFNRSKPHADHDTAIKQCIDNENKDNIQVIRRLITCLPGVVVVEYEESYDYLPIKSAKC